MKRVPVVILIIVVAVAVLYLAKDFQLNTPPASTERARAANTDIGSIPTRPTSLPPPTSDESSFTEYSVPHPLPPFAAAPTPHTAPAKQPGISLVRVVSATSFLVRVGESEAFVNLAGVKDPGQCDPSLAAFDAEARRYLESTLQEGEIRLQLSSSSPTAESKYIVRVVRPAKYEGVVDASGSYVNIEMIQNGYGCADEGDLPGECPISFGVGERIARQRERGMWRRGSPMETGFISKSQNSLAALTGQPAK